MPKYRITKYNPANRDENGHYLIDEWTSYHDIRRQYGGKLFTLEEYIAVENRYLSCLKEVFAYFNVSSVEIRGLESPKPCTLNNGVALHNGLALTIEDALEVCKIILREQAWCQLVSEKAKVEFGYDYYLYVTMPAMASMLSKTISSLKLFCEPIAD